MISLTNILIITIIFNNKNSPCSIYLVCIIDLIRVICMDSSVLTHIQCFTWLKIVMFPHEKLILKIKY